MYIFLWIARHRFAFLITSSSNYSDWNLPVIRFTSQAWIVVYFVLLTRLNHLYLYLISLRLAHELSKSRTADLVLTSTTCKLSWSLQFLLITLFNKEDSLWINFSGKFYFKLELIMPIWKKLLWDIILTSVSDTFFNDTYFHCKERFSLSL